jgi:hypothetical protein
MKKPSRSPQETARQIASTFFGVGPDKASQQQAIRKLLLSAVACAVLIPVLFYLRFGEVDGLGWGTTIFFVAYCLLAAIGIYFQDRTEYHTPVQLRGDWIDRVGAFWLICCVFGPFVGWMITAAFPLTVDSWRELYTLRVILAAGLPLITALSLTRYVRGAKPWVALSLLVIITLLPIWSVVNVSRDLWAGPVVKQVQSNSQPELYLRYTEQSLEVTR